jgi:hypothetical protein
MVCKFQTIARNNVILWYPDGNDAEVVAMQEKVNEVDEAKLSSSPSPKLISPYGEVSFFLTRNRY